MPNSLLPQRLLIVGFWFSSVIIASADDRTAADLLPPTTVAFAEIRQPITLLNTVYDHRITERIQSLDQVRAAMEKKQFLDYKAGVAVVESQMGMPWRKIVEQTTGGGLAIGLDAKTQGVVFLARAKDEAAQNKLVETLVNLTSLDAKTKGNPNPVKSAEYRGIKVYEVDKSKMAVTGGWLIVTNKDDTGKMVVDRLLDKPGESLAKDAQFIKARTAAGSSPTAWGYVNTKFLRDVGAAKKAFEGKADNPLAELILGGILSTLKQTPYVTVAVDVTDQHIQLSAASPHDRSWAGETREYYFGPAGKGAAPPQLLGKESIVSLSTYRDISAMWLRAGDLFNEQMNDELAKADSNLSTLFSGKDFGEDILGALKPEVQLVVARQTFAEGQPAPAIKLPSFGLVADLRDPAKMQPELRRTFQSLIGFLNIVGAMNGQPQLELDMEKTDKAQFIMSNYLPDTNAKDPLGLKINYNFSPSIAFAGNRFVVASTKSLAQALANATATAQSAAEATRVVNTDAVIHFDALREILSDNRGQLVAQNMLSDGHTKEEAEKEIGVLLELVGWFDQLAISLDTTENEIRLNAEVNVKAER